MQKFEQLPISTQAMQGDYSVFVPVKFGPCSLLSRKP